ncbi:MAG: (R)-1-hydroxy-2-aminoethylphosphonate ammonia-lyase [Prochlorotrichaceae cyanobacterium]
MSLSSPAPAESDLNVSPQREQWSQSHQHETLRSLLHRDAQAFLHQSASTPCLSAIRAASGIWLEDFQGRRFMDFHGNSAHNLGYGHPRLIAALQTQLQDLSFVPRRYTCEPAVELAETLTRLAPGNLSKVLFATGGSDAIEIALAYARAATGRFKTLSFWDAYHGSGFAARSIGGEAMFRSGPIGPLLPGAEHIPPFGDYRNAWGVTENSAELCLNQIRYVLAKEEDICALIAEPMRATNPVTAPPGFWQAVKAACHAHGALLIFDEIPTGLGRTGTLFACEQEGVVPDILVLGKALGGGVLPIAATLCRPDLDVCGNYAYGHYTHEKNPVTTRSALTTLQILESEGLADNARAIGELALNRLRDMMTRYPLIGDVRGRGCLIGVELVSDRLRRSPADDVAEMIMYKALERGLSFKVSMGNILILSPPLITTVEEMTQALDILETCIEEVA